MAISIHFGSSNTCMALWDKYENRVKILAKEPNNPHIQPQAEFSYPVKKATLFASCFVPRDETPTALAAGEIFPRWAFMKLKKTAEDYTRLKVSKAVITVPRNCSDSRRLATKAAANMAGLKIMELLQEPVAATFAYYDICRNLAKDELVLVYDLGARSFDVSLVGPGACDDRKLEVKAACGDARLGGEEFDSRVAEYFIEDFRRKHGVDISEHSRSLRRLLVASERAKIELSCAMNTVIHVSEIYEEEDVHSNLTRAKFERLNEDLFLKTLDLVKQCLSDAKIRSVEQLKSVIMVGGSCKIPRVQELLQDLFGARKVVNEIDAQEAVAYGAALHAAALSGNRKRSGPLNPPSLALSCFLLRSRPSPLQKSQTQLREIEKRIRETEAVLRESEKLLRKMESNLRGIELGFESQAEAWEIEFNKWQQEYQVWQQANQSWYGETQMWQRENQVWQLENQTWEEFHQNWLQKILQRQQQEQIQSVTASVNVDDNRVLTVDARIGAEDGILTVDARFRSKNLLLRRLEGLLPLKKKKPSTKSQFKDVAETISKAVASLYLSSDSSAEEKQGIGILSVCQEKEGEEEGFEEEEDRIPETEKCLRKSEFRRREAKQHVLECEELWQQETAAHVPIFVWQRDLQWPRQNQLRSQERRENLTHERERLTWLRELDTWQRESGISEARAWSTWLSKIESLTRLF